MRVCGRLTWHTRFVVGVQFVFTPAAPHVEAAAQCSHGSFPDSENVAPAAHATWHVVFEV